MDDKQKYWREPVERLIKTLIELSVHGFAVIAALIIFAFVHWILRYLAEGGSKEVLLFDKIPVRYLFDGADLLLLVGFLMFGTYFALKAYRGGK